MLRANFVTVLNLILEYFFQELGIIAQKVGAKSVQCVNVFVAINIPNTAAF